MYKAMFVEQHPGRSHLCSVGVNMLTYLPSCHLAPCPSLQSPLCCSCSPCPQSRRHHHHPFLLKVKPSFSIGLSFPLQKDDISLSAEPYLLHVCSFHHNLEHPCLWKKMISVRLCQSTYCIHLYPKGIHPRKKVLCVPCSSVNVSW